MISKRILFLIVLSQGIVSMAVAGKVKLYAFYTPSHKSMCDEWFLPSIQDDFELVLECFNQECKSGDYMDQGWIDTMVHKVDLVIRGIRENMGGYFIHSDVDIQFFGPVQATIESVLQDNDLVIQRDCPNGGLCAGFFACRANNKMLVLWLAIRAGILRRNGKHDQDLLNEFIKSRKFKIKWAFLPEGFFGGGTFSGKRWQPGEDLPIPNNPLMHHANWTVGIKNKIAQLAYVRSQVNARQ